MRITLHSTTPSKLTTTMSDWKAPMTKLVNQIYSKADAGTYYLWLIFPAKFSRHFFVSCRTVSEGSAGIPCGIDVFGGRSPNGSADCICRLRDTAAASGGRPSGAFGNGQPAIKHTIRGGLVIFSFSPAAIT